MSAADTAVCCTGTSRPGKRRAWHLDRAACRCLPEWTGVQGQRPLRIHTLTGDNPDPPAVGTDFGVGRVVVRPVLCGAGVPLGEDSCKVRIGSLNIVQHGAARHFLEGRFEVRSNKDSGGVSFREVLDGLDHRVCSVWSSITVM